MNKSSHECIFCGVYFNVDDTTHNLTTLSFTNGSGIHYHNIVGLNENSSSRETFKNLVLVELFLCPYCQKTQFIVRALGNEFDTFKKVIMEYPLGNYKNYNDDVVPKQIKEDYEEACSIVSLSPKSSATLSRRIIESILTDFFSLKDGRLVDKIRSLNNSQNKFRNAPDIIEELTSIRKLGNISAHFNNDKNVIPKKMSVDEAKTMLKAVEYIIDDTYIYRYNRDKHHDKMNKIINDLDN